MAKELKVEPRRYKVGEVTKRSGLSRQVIHSYTVLGLIHPVGRTAAGHRLYSEDVFKRLELIQQLKESDMTLRDIADTYFRNK